MGSIPVRVTKKYCRKGYVFCSFFLSKSQTWHIIAAGVYHHAFGVIGMREYENLLNYLSKYDIIQKSSSSVYANIREANYGQSKADMLSKFEIALKECGETEGWLQSLFNTNGIDEDTYNKHRNLCGRIRRMLISSCKTLKEHK